MKPKVDRAIGDLKANPKNPRKVTDKKKQMLQASLLEFGDLGGVVRNLRTNQLVSGHQRREVFALGKKASVQIERTYSPPTAVGTVAEGFILVGEERFAYREVDWPAEKEALANLASNRNAGDFDMPMLANLFGDLQQVGLDLDLSMFSLVERDSLLSAPVAAGAAAEDGPEAAPKATMCPSCGHEFYRSAC